MNSYDILKSVLSKSNFKKYKNEKLSKKDNRMLLEQILHEYNDQINDQINDQNDNNEDQLQIIDRKSMLQYEDKFTDLLFEKVFNTINRGGLVQLRFEHNYEQLKSILEMTKHIVDYKSFFMNSLDQFLKVLVTYTRYNLWVDKDYFEDEERYVPIEHFLDLIDEFIDNKRLKEVAIKLSSECIYVIPSIPEKYMDRELLKAFITQHKSIFIYSKKTTKISSDQEIVEKYIKLSDIQKQLKQYRLAKYLNSDKFDLITIIEEVFGFKVHMDE